jgi:hypothetical protein
MSTINDHVVRLIEEIAEAESELSRAEKSRAISHSEEFQNKYDKEIIYYKDVINRKMDLLKLLKD